MNGFRYDCQICIDKLWKILNPKSYKMALRTFNEFHRNGNTHLVKEEEVKSQTPVYPWTGYQAWKGCGNTWYGGLGK